MSQLWLGQPGPYALSSDPWCGRVSSSPLLARSWPSLFLLLGIVISLQNSAQLPQGYVEARGLPLTCFPVYE